MMSVPKKVKVKLKVDLVNYFKAGKTYKAERYEGFPDELKFSALGGDYPDHYYRLRYGKNNSLIVYPEFVEEV